MQPGTASIFRLISVWLVFASLLYGCQSNQQAAPTRDINLLYTEAAGTMIAGLDATRRAMPTQVSDTVESATPGIEEAVSATAMPPTPTDTLVPVTPTAVPNTSTPVPDQPTAVPTIASQQSTSLADSAAFVYLSPGLGHNVRRNTSWKQIVNVKNTGEKTWDEGYYLGYFKGEAMGTPHDLQLRQTVKPGETYTFTFEMTAPPDTGTRQVTWVFRDDNEGDLLYIDFHVTVIN